MEKLKAFPRGIFLYDLPDDKDPAEYETSTIRRKLQQRFLKLDQKEAAALNHRLVTKKLPVFETMGTDDFE